MAVGLIDLQSLGQIAGWGRVGQMGAGQPLILDPAQTLAKWQRLSGLSILPRKLEFDPLNPGLHLSVSQPRLGCLDQCPPSLFTAWE